MLGVKVTTGRMLQYFSRTIILEIMSGRTDEDGTDVLVIIIDNLCPFFNFLIF